MIYKYDELKNDCSDLNKFQEWKEYRENIIKIVDGKLGKQKDSVIIFGAGECNDLDIGYFDARFDKITLVDKNMESMKRGIEKFELINEDKIKLIEADFVGIADDEYKKYEDMLINGEPAKKIIKYIRSMTIKLEKTELELGIEKHQVGVCIGVHSQIIAMFMVILSYYSENYSESEIRKINEEINYMNSKVTKRLNTAIIKNVEDILFEGFDIKELSEGLGTHIFIPVIVKCIEEGRFDRVADMVKKGSVAGAFQGFMDIGERARNKEVEIISTSYMLWPFSKKVWYLMLLNTTSVKNSK